MPNKKLNILTKNKNITENNSKTKLTIDIITLFFFLYFFKIIASKKIKNGETIIIKRNKISLNTIELSIIPPSKIYKKFDLFFILLYNRLVKKYYFY